MAALFISHCSDDTAIMDVISNSLDEIFADSIMIFCTYNNGILPGKDRGPSIARMLQKSDAMIAIITDSYMRSVICLSEIAAFWAKGGNVLPIIYNHETGIEFINELFGQDLIYVSAKNKNTDDLFRWIEQHFGVTPDKAKLAEKWLDALSSDPDNLQNRRGEKSWRAFIGSKKQYEDFIHYCMKSGIKKIRDTPLSPADVRKNLVGKKQVFLLGTNNKGIISGNTEIFVDVLLNGGDLYVLIANKGSQFCRDVAAVESNPSMFDDLEEFEAEAHREANRFSDEFSLVQDHLRSIYRRAKKKSSQDSRSLGHLYFGCAFTLIRQTVILGLNPDDNTLWAWMTLTMPPKRASCGTISMEICEAMDDGNADNRTLTENIKEYVQEICELAKKYKQFYEITINSPLPAYFSEFGNLDTAKSEWKQYYDEAQRNMQQHQNCRKELIEIAAQHPLIQGESPDEIFRSRLDAGMDLYEKLRNEGKKTVIYVPGDLHIPDKRSLSSAGVQYILSTGRVSADDLLGEEMNRKYKGDEGVYNSADECYVASRVFLDGDFCRLHCVCSDSQAQRKKLFYWKAGVIPMIHTVPNDSFHNDFNETFDVVPDIIFNDHDWQDKNSVHYRRTRSSRKPGFMANGED